MSMRRRPAAVPAPPDPEGFHAAPEPPDRTRTRPQVRSPAMSDATPWAQLDATAQAGLVARGEATPSELVAAAIERIERVNPLLNAVIHPLFEKARSEARSPELARGPFRGVPFLVKDAVCTTAGDPYHAGMRFLKRHAYHAREDSELARRFRAAGFLVGP